MLDALIRAMLLVMAFSWVAKELIADWAELRSLLSVLWPELRVEILVSSVDVLVFSDTMLFLDVATIALMVLILVNKMDIWDVTRLADMLNLVPKEARSV